MSIGVEFLSLVLARCPPEKLNRQSGTSSQYCNMHPILNLCLFPSPRSGDLLLWKVRRHRDNHTRPERIGNTHKVACIRLDRCFGGGQGVRDFNEFVMLMIDVPLLRKSRIFEHVKMKVLVQSQRFMVFTIVDNLVARHREGVHILAIYSLLSVTEMRSQP